MNVVRYRNCKLKLRILKLLRFVVKYRNNLGINAIDDSNCTFDSPNLYVFLSGGLGAGPAQREVVKMKKKISYWASSQCVP